MSILGAIGGIIGGLLGKSSADKQAEMQMKFAKSGIQWKVADAQKAGIHPLYALGAQTAQYSPVTVGTDFAGIGQDVGRAIDATRTPVQKGAAVSKTVQDLSIQRMGLENELLATQIAKTRQAGNPPAFPAQGDGSYLIPGQGQTALGPLQGPPASAKGVRTVDLERIASPQAAPHMEAGPVSDIGFTQTGSGGLAPVYSSDAKQRLEDDFLGMLSWNVRNRLLPSIMPSQQTPPYKAPWHSHWEYDVMRQEYILKRHAQ